MACEVLVLGPMFCIRCRHMLPRFLRALSGWVPLVELLQSDIDFGPMTNGFWSKLSIEALGFALCSFVFSCWKIKNPPSSCLWIQSTFLGFWQEAI